MFLATTVEVVGLSNISLLLLWLIYGEVARPSPRGGQSLVANTEDALPLCLTTMAGSNPGLVVLADHGLAVVRLQGPNTELVPIGMLRGNGWHCGPTSVGNPLCPHHFQHTLADQWDKD